VFMTDHQRWDTIYPFHRAITPNLDAVAAGSTVFTNAYCTAPHCCPSRASFYSGLYPSEHGVWNNVNVGNALSRGLNKGVTLFPELLHAEGYHCMLSGKWHVSAEEGPLDRGFHECYNFGIPYRKYDSVPDDYEWDLYYKNNKWEKICDAADIREESQIVRTGYPIYTQYGRSEDPFGDVTTVDHALDMMKKHQDGDDRPLFLFTGVSGPHDPYRVPEEFEALYRLEDIRLPDNFTDTMDDKPGLYRRVKEMFAALPPEEHRRSILKYLAFCSFEDHLFGRVFDQAMKLPGRTVVIYLSDHGDYMGEHGLWAKGLPCFDGAYHIPLVVYDSAAPVPRLVDEFVSLTDLAPTILDLCEIRHDRSFSGSTLLPFLRGESSYSIRDGVYTQSNGNELYGIQRSVKNRDYKLVYNGFDYDEFYDLRRDPGEMTNVFGQPEYEDAIRTMYRRLWQFAYEKKDTCINPYIMVGLAKYGPGIIFDEK
jgi:arylsulfatase A-like enzyme